MNEHSNTQSGPDERRPTRTKFPYRRMRWSPPARGRRRRLLLAAGATFVLGAIGFVMPALASSGPEIKEFRLAGELAEPVHATWVQVGADVSDENVTWRLEAEPAGEGYKVVASGTDYEQEPLGQDKVLSVRVHHLKPSTHYTVRLVVESARGTVEKSLEFTTKAPEAPEVEMHEAKNKREASLPDIGTTYAGFLVTIDAGGSETIYNVEYSSEPGNPASWQPVSSGASGSVSVAEDFVTREARVTGLVPATRYWVRARATNAIGEARPSETSFTTHTQAPTEAYVSDVFDATADSAFALAGVVTHGFETAWRIEYATSKDAASWTTGAQGTIGLAQAVEAEEAHTFLPPTKITGLRAGMTYYVRLWVENAHGVETSSPFSVTTAGAPVVTTLPVHAFAVGGEAMRVLGSVEGHAAPVDEVQTIELGGAPEGGTFTLSFKGQTTSALRFDARPSEVEAALVALASVGAGNLRVISAELGPPYSVEFEGALGGAAQPLIAGDPSGLTPAGSQVIVAVAQEGLSYEPRAWFEYVGQRQFEASGWSEAASTPKRPIDGHGDESFTYGEDLPGLREGESYRYRAAAGNATPGDPVVEGPERALTVPSHDTPVATATCANQALRFGPSQALPDCRAYEQVTPSEKAGSMDTFNYTPNAAASATVGEDGEHVLVKPFGAKWGSSADATNTSYFFAREADGWQMTATTPQPQAGDESYRPAIVSPDLTELGAEVGWATSLETFSPNVEFDVGPPGGPYTTVATAPRARGTQWVASAPDFSRAVLASEDRSLVSGHSTGSISGLDLYEYGEGRLRQLNVTTAGATIGRCGAQLVKGDEGSTGAVSPHALSNDGARAFFEAAPGGKCGEEQLRLYMRTAGAKAETVEIGTYKFLATDPKGERLLLEREGTSGGAAVAEFFLYETGPKAVTPLFTLPGNRNATVVASEDIGTVYVGSAASLTPDAPVPTSTSEDAGGEPMVDLYRYDTASAKMTFTGVQYSPTGSNQPYYVSPEGRYLYLFSRGVAGVYQSDRGHAEMLYRYDGTENRVQCVSCASAFDPTPDVLTQSPSEGTKGAPDYAVPRLSYATADGRYAFFDTAAALVPADVDGEVPPCHSALCGPPDEPGNYSGEYSVSSDVYEWRAYGVNGCANAQGCIALISSGTGGLKNMLLGIAAGGRDVFFTTHSQLVAQDRDGQGDVYDARIGGGFAPPPPRPTECEGDACSQPPSAPIDVTPASLTFAGAGNVAVVQKDFKAAPKQKKKKHKPARKGKNVKSRRRAGRRHGRASARERGRVGGSAK